MRTETFYAVQRKHTTELTGRLVVGDTILAIGSVTTNGTPETPASEFQIKWGTFAGKVSLTSGTAAEFAKSVIENPQSDCYGISTGSESVEPFRVEIQKGKSQTVEIVKA